MASALSRKEEEKEEGGKKLRVIARPYRGDGEGSNSTENKTGPRN